MGTFCKADQDNLHGFKIKLYPTEAQKDILNRQIDLFRYVYNWALEVEHKNYDENKKSNVDTHFLREREMYDLLKEMRNSPEKVWLKELPLNTCRHAVLKLISSFKKFFSHQNKYPKFKSKKTSNKYFCFRGERLHFYENGYLHIEGFKRGDNILYKGHSVQFTNTHKYYNCTVSFDGIDYWLSFTIELYQPLDFRCCTTDGIGIDLGLRKLAKLSNGKEYHLPDTSKYEKRKKRLQRKVSKDIQARSELASQMRIKFEDVEPTKNSIKRYKAFRSTANHITNIRKNYIHNMTSEIVKMNPEFIAIETLNVKGMLKNKYLARNISASSFYEIRTQLEYKSKMMNIPIILADREFPSTKMCSRCGNIYNVGKSETYRCPSCGLVIDRDLNAALNLRNYGMTVYES